MRKKARWLVTFLVAAILIGVPLADVTWQGQRVGNGDSPETYRSGKLSAAQLQDVVAAHHVRTVVSLHEDK